MHTLIFLSLSILKEDFKTEPWEIHWYFTLCVQQIYRVSMQYKKDNTAKYGPGEMLPPAIYCNQGNKGEIFQVCLIFQKVKFRVRQIFSAQTKPQSGYLQGPQQNSAKPQLMKQEKGKLNQWWHHYNPKLKEVLAWLIHAGYPALVTAHVHLELFPHQFLHS